MVKKILPILTIISIWFIFSFPVFLQNKIAYPSDFQVNNYSLWNQYEKFWGPVKNPAMPDVVGQLYPWKKFTIENLKSGQLPLWDPYTFSGTPHLANYQSAVFSPTNIFYFIFDFNNAWNLAVVIQPLLTGIFMYLFARSLKLSNPACILSSASFMFCGFITTWMNYTTLALAISFLPLALFSIEKYFFKSKIIWLLLLSSSITLSFLSGHFQTSLYLGIFVYAYIIFKSITNKNLPKFIYLNIFYFLGILIASPQILPTLEFYLNSFRSKNFEKINPLPINHLPLVIAPDFYGNPVTRNNFSLIYAEYSMFAGTIPFFLSLLTLFSKNKTAIFFILTALISFIFGLDTPLVDVIVKLQIPVISTSSLSRVLVIFSFSIAILGGIGLDYLIQILSKKNYKTIIYWILLGISLIGIIWLFIFARIIDPQYYPISLKNMILPSTIFSGLIFAVIIGFKKSFIKISILLLVLLTIFDMLRFATKWQPYTSKDLVFPETPIIKELTKLDSAYRVHAPISAEGGVYYNLQLTDGYNPLYINKYGELIGSISDGILKTSQRYTVSLPLESENLEKISDLLAIKYVLLKKSDLGQPWSYPIQKYSDKKTKIIYSDNKFIVYENLDAFPKAFLVSDYVIETDSQKIINKIIDKNFDFKKTVILEKDPKIIKGKSIGKTKLIDYKINNVKIITSSDKDSILVLTDNYYPGWHAKINGKEKEILRSNYTFRALPIPAGENNIEFYYEPESFKLGMYLSILSISLILIIIAISWYTKTKWNHHNKTATSVTKSSAKTANGKQTEKKQKKSKKEN